MIFQKDSLIADGSGISELLNAAYASHEITDEYLTEVKPQFPIHWLYLNN